MLKKLLVILTIVVSTSIFLACGNTTTNSTTTQSTTNSTTTTVTTTTTETTTTTTEAPIILEYQGAILSDGKVGDSYLENIDTATGSEHITYSLKSGSELPDGLSLIDGVISGTPTTVGTTEFLIVAQAVDAVSPVEATFTIEIPTVSLNFQDQTLNNGIVGDLYYESVDFATGSNITTYSLKPGSELPDGLSLTDGVISGTPTTSGTSEFIIIADALDAEEPVEATFTIYVQEEGTTVTLTYEDLTLTAGTIGTYYTAYIGTATGSSLITYTLKSGSELPDGLSLVDKLISGTPTTTGTFTFTIVADATNAEAPVEATFTLVITKVTLNYQGSSLSDGRVGESYTTNIDTATGSNFITYSLKTGNELPDGLSLIDNIISGTPLVSGDYSFIIVADALDAINPVEAAFTLHVEEEIKEPQDFIFEAEYIDLTDQRGSGWSNTQVEWGMVMGDGETTATSNGMYIAYFTPPYATLRFPFTSDEAGKGTLMFSMVSEYVKDHQGTLGMLLDSSIMTLKINGVEIEYRVFILGENQPTIAFQEYIFLDEFDILEGENIIEITILENDYFPGRPGGGPNVDYMKIVSDLNLVMDLFVDNVEAVKELRGY